MTCKISYQEICRGSAHRDTVRGDRGCFLPGHPAPLDRYTVGLPRHQDLRGNDGELNQWNKGAEQQGVIHQGKQLQPHPSQYGSLRWGA